MLFNHTTRSQSTNFSNNPTPGHICVCGFADWTILIKISCLLPSTGSQRNFLSPERKAALLHVAILDDQVAARLIHKYNSDLNLVPYN